MTTLIALLMMAGVATPPPIMQAEDTMDRGATVMYTITLEEGLDYWILLTFDETGGRDMDILMASDDMDYDNFLQLPFYEDYMYARGFALAEGATEGSEDFVLTSPYTGTVYIVIHDIGETGGDYNLRIF
jgi:hypothetical protein